MNTISVNCMKCEHFYITWDKAFPNGCKLFGFKTKNMPNKAVAEATGNDCQNFQKKNYKSFK